MGCRLWMEIRRASLQGVGRLEQRSIQVEAMCKTTNTNTTQAQGCEGEKN